MQIDVLYMFCHFTVILVSICNSHFMQILVFTQNLISLMLRSHLCKCKPVQCVISMWMPFFLFVLDNSCSPAKVFLFYLYPTLNKLYPLQWRHNERDSVSNHQPHDCLLNRLFRRRSKKTSKLRVTGLCEGNSPGTGEFPAQMASNAENVSIWWRHHVKDRVYGKAKYKVANST